MGRSPIAIKMLILAGLALAAGAASVPAGEAAPADDATLAEFKKLLPWAAAADEDTIAAIAKGAPFKLENIKNQSLTACVLVGLLAGPKKDISETGKPGDAEAAMSMLVGMTVIKKEHISKLTADVSADGKLAKGVVEIKNKAFTAGFPFEARKLDDGKWQVFAFELPKTALRVERDAARKWRASELLTTDPLLRLHRAVKKAESRTLPVAYKSDELSSEALAPYGWFRSQDGKPQPLAEGGKGAVLLIDAEAKYSELLAMARDDKTKDYVPAAVVIGSEFGLTMLPLPAISDAKPQVNDGVDMLYIHVSSAGSEGRLKDVPKFRIRDWEVNSVPVLAQRLKQLRAAVDMPVRIVPTADTPVKHVIAAVDATLWADLRNAILVPTPAEKPAEKK